MKATYFDLREELKQRFITISVEPGAEDEPFGSAEVIAEANNDCAFMKEIQKSIAKKMAEAAEQCLRQQLGIPVGKDLQRHWFENSQLPHGYGRPDRIADCTRHQGPFRLNTEAT
jgi:hypothetical protein